jgi:hypothetical protein
MKAVRQVLLRFVRGRGFRLGCCISHCSLP